MHIDSSADWRQTFPSRVGAGELWVRWLRVALPPLTLFLLVPVAATLLRVDSRSSLTALLLIVTAAWLLGALMRTGWPLSAMGLPADDRGLHPAVTLALRRVGRALDEGMGQRGILELIARCALEITRGATCLLTQPDGSRLQIDRSDVRWMEAGSEGAPAVASAPGGETEESLRVELTALGETLGILEVWPGPGQRVSPGRESRLALFCAEAAVAARDAAVLSRARTHADALESRIEELQRWQGQLDVYAVDLARTYGELNRTRSTLDETYMATLEALAGAVDARDPYTYGHCRRVAELASRVAVAMAIPERDRHGLEQAALLHDIGKIGVPDAILRKTTPLTREEWEAIQTHPELGFKMLAGLRFLSEALPAIRHHHERYDGTGYPDRLAGEEIPLAARILAVADAYDAITSDRPYRPGRPKDQGLAEIHRSARSYFDPAVVEALLSTMVAQPESSSPESRSPAPDTAEREMLVG